MGWPPAFASCCIERATEIWLEIGDVTFSQARLDFDGLMLKQPAFREWLFSFGKQLCKIGERPPTTTNH